MENCAHHHPVLHHNRAKTSTFSKEKTLIRIRSIVHGTIIINKEVFILTHRTTINMHVQKIAAIGHHTEYLFAHLIKDYRSVPDKHFCNYMMNSFDRHFDNTNVLIKQSVDDMCHRRV